MVYEATSQDEVQQLWDPEWPKERQIILKFHFDNSHEKKSVLLCGKQHTGPENSSEEGYLLQKFFWKMELFMVEQGRRSQESEEDESNSYTTKIFGIAAYNYA